MKVWLVWTGEYSDARVVGVYSTRELAEDAAQMHITPEGWIDNEDGYEVDADAAMVRAGYSRWWMYIGVDDGAITRLSQRYPGTGEPPRVVGLRDTRSAVTLERGPRLSIDCDARNRDHAVKIAGDERAKYLATAKP